MSSTDADAVLQRTNAVSLADEDLTKKVVVDSILGLWDVVNNRWWAGTDASCK